MPCYYSLDKKMVNTESAVHLINNYISEKQIRPMKNWSSRKRYCQNTNVLQRNVFQITRLVKKLLNIISGNDIVEMLKGMLE